MASINKTEFKVLELNGKNYQTWALDCEFHLQAMQLTPMIARPAAGVPAPPPHDKAKACILRFCDQVVTELDMIEKTLETFHPTNMVLQQQYRNNKYMKYCDLINVLLAVEAQNELLMKNFHMRPVGTQAHPEAHASFRNSNEAKKERGKFKNRGQKSNCNGKGQKFNGNGKGRSLKGSKDEHWSRTCTTDPHLIELYQEWKKRQNPEVHFVQASVVVVTGLHLLKPSEPTEKLESATMDVDHNATGDRTAEKGDAYTGDDDFDLDNEDLLDED
ncbi:unnamed protein product [Miscanthus lutarioriparius]|uniref:Uncharacterized protein n=1 Tax=Miscanthus lutarioriparius TaxID=422564 RepID=A0A811M9M0_9POAL|nr:unnamed protein product [Miscanthus lutarioriparius]